MRETERHNDRSRVVETLDGDTGRVLRSRPMRIEEVKSGEWRHPQPWIDERGLPQPRPPSFHRANTPEQYRQLCRSLLAKGFTPLSPVPLAEVTVKSREP